MTDDLRYFHWTTGTIKRLAGQPDPDLFNQPRCECMICRLLKSYSFPFPVTILFIHFCACEQNLDWLCSALCLLIPWIFLEKPKMDAQGTWSFQPLVLILNSLCTFALNLSVFLVIQHTSALTIRVAGVVKDWVVVLLSALLFADTKLTLINIFGYAIGN